MTSTASFVASDEFVDLYELLGASPNAPIESLRARISALYTEAQRNLDHHNFRKRFYFQQLFEVHLPQAHSWLLDPRKRAYYDTCLTAFRAGEPFPDTSALDTALNPQTTDQVLPTRNAHVVPESQTPFPAPDLSSDSNGHAPAEQPATGIEKTGSAGIDTAQPLTPAPATQIAGVASLPLSATKPSLAERAAAELAERERRRDHKRRGLIEREEHTASWSWGCVGGAAVAGISLLVLAVLIPHARRGLHSLIHGMAATVILWLVGLMIVGGIGCAAGIVTARYTRRYIVARLSKMPYEELLRRCARR